MKAVSVCAAGAIAASCLAAAVVPGIGGLELLSHGHHALQADEER